MVVARQIRRLERSGFSLMELMVVLVIMSLIASVITLRWIDLLEPATVNQAADRMERIDAQIRLFAETHQCQCDLIVDPVGRQFVIDRWTDPPTRRTISWARRVDWSPFQLNSPTDSNDTELFTDSVDRIRFFKHGTSSSYSIELRSQSRSIRLQFAGITGYCSRSDR